MARVGDPGELARILNGSWCIRASSLSYWSAGTRLSPSVTYEVASKSPLALAEHYSYERIGKGAREMTARAEWKGNFFSWRVDAPEGVASAYVVSDTPATPDVIAIHMTDFELPGNESRVSILSREHVDHDQVRALVSKDTYSFELTRDEFWQLSWLGAA